MIQKLERNVRYLLILCLVLLGKVLMPDIVKDMEELLDREAYSVPTYAEKTAVTVSGELPSYFDAREEGYAPVVKDQGQLGTCWAVAASSALEGSVGSDGLIFAADHLSLENSFARGQNDGGDYTMIMAYLAAWQGPVLEENDPYGDGISDASLSSVKHVQEMQLLKDLSVEELKKEIYDKRVVQASIYMDLDSSFSTSVYYNQLEHSYYYNGDEQQNHDVCIIGWDDDYPASAFNVETDKNGAFICQNSWGTEFGEEGIFYVSYEDTTLAQNALAYTKIENTDNYDHLYQTDLCGWVGSLGYGDGTCYFANVFRPERSEYLSAVGFYALGRDTEYEVYVMDGEEKLEHVMLEEEVASGKVSYPGFYTVNLNNMFRLEEGKAVTVVVRVETPGEEYPVATEYAAGEETKNVILSDGDGYISHNGMVWQGTESGYGCNVCMKIYTKNNDSKVEIQTKEN